MRWEMEASSSADNWSYGLPCSPKYSARRASTSCSVTACLSDGCLGRLALFRLAVNEAGGLAGRADAGGYGRRWHVLVR